jgi:hypothetical protein
MVASVASSSFSYSPYLTGTASARSGSRDPAARSDPDRNAAQSGPAAPGGPDGPSLSVQDQQIVETLQARDREVRAHEAAHLAAAAGLALSGASFSYTRGPDGRSYATGGEVSIDVSPVPDDPQATIAKARQIHRAALAPARPSGQDRAVAARAVQMEAEAQQDLARLAAYRNTDPARQPGTLLDRFA